MKRYFLLILAVVFVLSFAASYYLAADDAYAGCHPCSTPTCGSLNCLDWGVVSVPSSPAAAVSVSPMTLSLNAPCL